MQHHMENDLVVSHESKLCDLFGDAHIAAVGDVPFR
jgi:hypothetical protein